MPSVPRGTRSGTPASYSGRPSEPRQYDSAFVLAHGAVALCGRTGSGPGLAPVCGKIGDRARHKTRTAQGARESCRRRRAARTWETASAPQVREREDASAKTTAVVSEQHTLARELEVAVRVEPLAARATSLTAGSTTRAGPVRGASQARDGAQPLANAQRRRAGYPDPSGW